MSVRLNKALLASTTAVIMAAAPFVANFEGWRNNVYGDSLSNAASGLATVCAGHTDRMGTVRITKQHYTDTECTKIEIQDLQITDREVSALVGPSILTMPVKRRVALIDFAYNLGIGTLRASGIPKILQEGNVYAACSKILDYDKGTEDGRKVVISGLERRREAEFEYCLAP